MPQVITPNLQKDDSVDNLAAGLQIYSTVQDFRAKSAKEKASAPSAPYDYSAAMQRRLESEGG